MFVHIAPEYEALGETIGTLKFAERVATVELGAAKVNKDSGEVKELKEQVSLCALGSFLLHFNLKCLWAAYCCQICAYIYSFIL